MKIESRFLIQMHGYHSFMGSVLIVPSHRLIYVRSHSVKGINILPKPMDMRLIP